MRFVAVYFAFLFLCCNTASSQYIQKKWFDKTDSVYGYYTVIPPSSGRVQGAVVLLDGYGGNADGFLSETKIHNVAWNNDLLTVCIPTNTRFYLDSSMQVLLNRTLKEVMKDYDLGKDQFAIGGMSSGGIIAVRYAELCHEKPDQFPIIPQAVFDVDSPLDLIGLYQSSQRDLQKNSGGWWLGEAKMIVDRFNKELGNPSGDISKYKAVSPFLKASADTVNERSLRNVAVRSYHDVDVTWFIQNRGRSIYETNMLDGSEFISRLVRLGNTQAEFISSKNPGRRSNGVRHPHSWNIVDEIDLVQWIREKLHFYPDHVRKPYTYTAPDGWTPELIVFPMEFAPGIPYKGFEDLRFAPGWADDQSEEKWAYTILWWLDKKYEFNENTLAKDLNAYYSGLTKTAAISGKLDMAAYTPAKTEVKKTKTVTGDIATYTAICSIFDSEVSKKPGKLFFKIHVKDCGALNRTVVLIEAAATTPDQPVWKKLDKINEDFRCEK